jgi:shikimate kinase
MAAAKSNIYLIGPMGSGKSTIGARLAQKLGMPFYDSDHEIEARTGASVRLIFDIEGEKGFRKRECRMLRELAKLKGVLVATGGGAILEPANRELLRKSGLVIYLRTSVGQQLDRLSRDRSRPLLQQDDRERSLLELAQKRNPLYEQTADLVFPAKNRNIDSTVNLIHQAICESREAEAATRGGSRLATSKS